MSNFWQKAKVLRVRLEFEVAGLVGVWCFKGWGRVSVLSGD